MYSSEPIHRPSTAPASAAPLADLSAGVGPRPGPVSADGAYLVIPRALAETMPLPWQQRFSALLDDLHRETGALPWPVYRVTPCRTERVADCDEDQLGEVGYAIDVSDDGDLVYRDGAGAVVGDPESRTVLVSCADPVLRRGPG